MQNLQIQEIENRMAAALDNEQLELLHEVLVQTLQVITEDEDDNYLEMFLAAKKVEGCSDKTIKYYNLYEGSILNKSSDVYSFTNSGKRTSLKNIMLKILLRNWNH